MIKRKDAKTQRNRKKEENRAVLVDLNQSLRLCVFAFNRPECILGALFCSARIADKDAKIAVLTSKWNFERSLFKGMDMTSIDDGILYGDAAYNDYELEDQLEEAGLYLMVDRKINSKRPRAPDVTKQISRKRKIVETCFSGILKLFPRILHAVRMSGILLKLTLFFGAFTSMFIT